MLSKRQNLFETIHGGSPDRFVNQFEAFAMAFALDPLNQSGPRPEVGKTWVNAWGVTQAWPEGVPGIMPVHTDDLIVMKDITKWRETIKAPKIEYTQNEFDLIDEYNASVDKSEQITTLGMFPGLLEQLHHLMGMTGAMMALALEPDYVAEFLDFYIEWEMELAQPLLDRIHPEALFHHDDWGSHRSTLISPDMFGEIFVPVYKKLYGFFRDNGVELIIHHSDSYAATLVPHMIDIGIDIWQGVVTTNDIPALIKEYGGRISFMGGLNNGYLDREDWTDELVAQDVERACREGGKLYFIPNLAGGGPSATFPGVYEAVTREIDRMSSILF
jgi:hypothetical protein